MKIIELNGLTKMYGKSRGITDVSFHVDEGEIFGFIGPNGAGKSTTIRTLLGLIYPTSGSATIFGKDIRTHGPEIKREIGYLPSEVFYYDNMKVKDVLRYSASFYKKDSRTRIAELAERFRLDLNKRVEDLSLGNKKKVGIIQGLLHEPKLIILDEPTSGLDPLMQQQFFDLMEEENKKGVTIFFSSHILSEVQRLCDRVAIIKEGKIIALEKMNTLKQNTYKRIRIETATDVSVDAFHFDGVSELHQHDRTIRFMYRGNIHILLQRLAAVDATDVWIEDPDLEEIFLHYYTRGE